MSEQSSNLCTEIIEYTDANEVAVCNLASISLKAFVDEEALAAGKLGVEAFDHEKLCEITKIVTCVLNIWRHLWSFLLPGGCCALVGSDSRIPVRLGAGVFACSFYLHVTRVDFFLTLPGRVPSGINLACSSRSCHLVSSLTLCLPFCAGAT